MRARLVVAPLLLVAACSGRAASGPALPGNGAGEPVAPPPVGPSAPPTAGEAPGEEATLVLDGTPPIPEALRTRLEAYLETRSASIMDLADDGKSMLIGTRFGESSQIHRVAMPGGARTQLTFSREPSSAGLLVPGQSRSLVYMRDIGGNEQFQLYRLDLAKGSTVRLTDGKSRNVSPLWSEDGRKLAWGSTARNGRDVDIWIGDGAKAESAALAVEAKGDWEPVSFSPDGKRLLVIETISITSQRIHVADLEKKTVTALTPAEPPAAYREAELAAGNKAYVTSDKGGEFVELYEVDLAKQSWKSLSSHIKWNVEEIELTRDGKTLAFTVNEGGISRIHLLDTRTRKEKAVTSVPKGIASRLVFARKAPVLGFTLATATRTGDAYTYDLRKKKVTRWTESEMGGLDTTRLVEPTLIEFKSFDGMKIPAFYYRPAGPGPFPVVINIHGGPEAQSRPYFSGFVQFLVSEAGIAVLDPNVRGSDGYGKTYLTLDNGARREDSVKDIGALLDWVAGQKDLDAKRVAVVGGSYGGYMVLASLVHFGDRLRAGVDVVGISSFITFLENTAEYRRDLRRVEYGDERDPDMRKKLEAISPLNHVDKIRSALFVAQGANDPRVPAGEAKQIVEAVRKAGKDVWFMLARDEGHGFQKKGNRDTFALLGIMFLEKHLKQ
jgi:dipeptidyl aminopeptidase/acylaminoacyl peptidase